MTATLDHAPDLAALTDDELAAAFPSAADAGQAAILAEAARRDRQAHKRRAARREAESDWYHAAYAQYLRAEAVTAGNLLSDAGQHRKDPLTGKPWPVDPFTLWSGSQWEVDAYASRELAEFWEADPRVTRAEWKRQARRSEETYRDDLDRDDGAGVRREDDGPQGAGSDSDSGGHAVSPPDAGAEAEEGEPGAGADAGRGPVVRDSACDVSTGTCKHPHRAGTRKQCSDCPLGKPARTGDDIRASVAARAARLAEIRAAMAPVVLAHRGDTVLIPGSGSTGTVATVPGADIAPAARKRARIDGAETLNYARMFLGRFALWPSDAALDAVTLWCAHAHAKDGAGMLVWQASPRLLYQSAEPGSGKSYAMRLTARLCPAPAVFTEPSEPAVAHAIGKEHATLFLDEVDVLFGRGARKAAIRAVINDGYTPDGSWARVRGGQVERIPTFGALAMAGLDALETGTDGHLKALLTRCIRIRMRRGPEGYRPPRWDKEAAFVATKVAERLGQWCAQELGSLGDAVPEVPEGTGNREAELWEPLLAVADAAGGRWPDAARLACEEMTLAAGLPDDDEAAGELDRILAAWSEAS